MRIQFLNGGLANQVFQYIFYRYAEIHLPEESWFLDDSFFFVHDIHNGYELDRVFGLNPRLLSDSFDKDVWEYMMSMKRTQNTSIPELLRQNGETVLMIAETSNWSEWNPFDGEVSMIPANGFYPEILNIPGNTVYYHGYWINRNWLHAHRDMFLSELSFPEIDEPHNISYLSQIESTNACAVHIRRGDYVTLQWAFPDAYYYSAIQKMLLDIPDMTLFVFSDDPEYCLSHKESLGLSLVKETVFVSGNAGVKAFRDMQLMTKCANMIIANSAFSFLATLLNTRLQKLINPTQKDI